ncbi:ABC transporter permease [Paracoccus sp. 228]|uniref:ABC transporter permease n=1 Tax=Paracoccus sp. 228 TaxID=1192054 RepID=UPI0005E8A109|nr:ABC transporter permease [Paracoccus sp. 228]KIX16286.1 branched-chain amino acid ABC transporter permease [Paracoccus sp. 228]
MTDTTASTPSRKLTLEALSNYAVIASFALIVVFFAVFADGFLSSENLMNLVLNKVVILAVVALGMTLVIAAGGIDLSVGVSVDLSSMVFIMMIAAGISGVFAVAGGLAAAICVGIVNAVLINKLKINPFLATLGVLFIGETVQRVSTQGGVPIYLTRAEYAAPFNAIVRTHLFGVPTPIVVLIVAALAVYITLHRSVFGRYVSALGAAPDVVRYSGIRVPLHMSIVFIACAAISGVAGILLSSTVRSYVPFSGDAFLLDAIGATFIGTAISAERRPSVVGTLLGVLLLAVMRNGLLLIGWNFFWQQVGIGVLVFLVLGVSFGLRRRND